MSLQAVFCFDRKEVSFSAQQAGQMPEELHQEEFGECFLRFLLFFSTITLSLCQNVSSPSHLPSNLPDPSGETGSKSKKKSHQADSQATFDRKQEIPEDAPPFG